MLDRSEKARELNEFKLAGFSLLAVRTGLEPATPCVTGMYSNQAELPHQSSYFKEREPLFLRLRLQNYVTNSNPANF